MRGVAGARIDRVRGIQSGAAEQRSPDGKLRLAAVRFQGSSGEAAVLDAADTVRHETVQRLEGTGVRAGLTGEAAIKLHDRMRTARPRRRSGSPRSP